MHPSGRPILSNKAFQDAEPLYPKIGELWQLRGILSKFRLNDITVGEDGFNRCSLFPFAARTSRNLPSNKEYIFGVSSFLRSLIQPPWGYAICYLDWRAQEFGIAAVFSDDPNMIDAYMSGDCYLGFAKLAKAVPHDATKVTHKLVRNLYKRCVLGINYGMEYESLSVYIGQPPCVARDLLQKHKRIFRKYWEWSENIVRWALIHQEQSTVFGWREMLLGDCGRKTDKTLDNEWIVNPKAISNFPMQANAAEILRLACCLGTEYGLHICGPIHDAVLILAPISEIMDHIIVMRKCMTEASRVVLNGFELKVDGEPIFHPGRFVDERGIGMWQSTMESLAALEREESMSAA